MEKQVIERNIWIDASRDRVWQALNDPEQLAQWFLPPFLNARMKRDADNKLYVLMGPMETPVMTFEAADPPRQITIRGFPDQMITATCTLEEKRGGVLVTVTMGGFETLPEGAYQERAAPSSAGWEKGLENLKAHVDGSDLPFPQGYVAALLGYRIEAGEKYAVERTIWLDAPRERVWRALTDPRQIQQWFSPGIPWRLSALEVGGTLSPYDAETGADIATTVIDVLEPPHRLVVRAVAEPPAHQDVTTYTLTEENGGTRLILISAGYELLAAEERHPTLEQNAFGFGMMLENLQAYLMGRELPYPFGF